MLLGIIADLHANLEATCAVLKKLDEVRPAKIVCLGDVTGYYSNPNEVIEILRERNISIVLGNHDAAVCGLDEPWFFNENAQSAIHWQRANVKSEHMAWLRSAVGELRVNCEILAVHGAPGNRDDYILDWLDSMRYIEYLVTAQARVCFFGHSHRPCIFGDRGIQPRPNHNGLFVLNPHNRYFINPGSVGQPRDHDSRAAFGLYETEDRMFEFCRVTYDIEKTMTKTLEAGLPQQLAYRLAKGK